jgi:hypothetical protein
VQVHAAHSTTAASPERPCRHTWSQTGARQVDTLNHEAKEGITAMIANNVAGNVLPMMLCVKGKTFTCMQKYVSRDPQAWGALGPEVKGNARRKFC